MGWCDLDINALTDSCLKRNMLLNQFFNNVNRPNRCPCLFLVGPTCRLKWNVLKSGAVYTIMYMYVYTYEDLYIQINFTNNTFSHSYIRYLYIRNSSLYTIYVYISNFKYTVYVYLMYLIYDIDMYIIFNFYTFKLIIISANKNG